MSDEEIERFAENLLRPQLNAELEASQQAYETGKLSREQEIENLAASLTRSIDEQKSAYRRSMADVETAALARGMGRSSYTMQSLANQGDAMARSIRELTEESERKQEQIGRQITQSAEQNAQTQGRLNADYAAQYAAKVQELQRQRDQARNDQYLTALSATMSSETTKTGTTNSETTSRSTSQQTGSADTVTDTTGESSMSGGSTTLSGSLGSGSGGKKTAQSEPSGKGVDRTKRSATSTYRSAKR